MGCSRCDPGSWSKLNADDISKQFGAFIVKLFGPKFAVFNDMIFTEATEVSTFGNMELKLVSTIKESLLEGDYQSKSRNISKQPVQRAKAYWSTHINLQSRRDDLPAS